MNEYELQIFFDNDTVNMIEHLTDAGIYIDFLMLLSLMADNAESISDFIQSIECGEPQMMLPVTDSTIKRLIIKETNKLSVSPEKYMKAAIAILYSDNIFQLQTNEVLH